MRILIGADLVPTDTNQALFDSGDVQALLGQELLDILQQADCRIFNLEIPLTDRAEPIDKNGPALIAPTTSVTAYRALGADLLTVANNHILDQGEAGFESTLRTLEGSKIAYVGGGTLQEAQQPRILEVSGKKIGVYACAEHEFSIAKEDKPGANPFDPLESPDHVAALKAQCDYVIVLHHGGKEHYRYPSPNLQKVCRKLVEKGADLVVCQHSHCVGCEEKYRQGTIVYGQGNFLFDHSKSEYWQTGLLIQIADDFSITYLPLRKQENMVRLASGEDAQSILQTFQERSEQIKDPLFIKEQYAKFAKTMRTAYLLSISSFRTEGLLFRVLDKLTNGSWGRWLVARAYKKKKMLRLRNYMECEAHAELLLQSIEE